MGEYLKKERSAGNFMMKMISKSSDRGDLSGHRSVEASSDKREGKINPTPPEIRHAHCSSTGTRKLSSRNNYITTRSTSGYAEPYSNSAGLSSSAGGNAGGGTGFGKSVGMSSISSTHGVSPRASGVTPRALHVSSKDANSKSLCGTSSAEGRELKKQQPLHSLPTINTTAAVRQSSAPSPRSSSIGSMLSSFPGLFAMKMKGGGSRDDATRRSSKADREQAQYIGDSDVVSIRNPALAPTKKISTSSTDKSTGEGGKLVCDKCDGNHHTDACPYFKKPRENHVDATSRGKGLGSSKSNLPGATLRGARVVRQPGDGSCLFHSMAYGLKNGSANSLRSEICSYIVNSPSMKISDTPISDWVRWDSGSTVSDYARRMSRGAWGGGIEMAVVSKMKNVNVHVYERSYSGFKRISAFDTPNSPESRPIVRVLYCGGVHYDALVA